MPVLLAAAAAAAAPAGLLPIFFMHGVNDNDAEFDGMQGWIRAIDPNVTMYSLPICNDGESYTNLWLQGQMMMDRMREKISASPDVYKDGYTLLAHSQGALTSRTVVERMDDHNVHTFIGLAGPQAGEFGIPAGGTTNKFLEELENIGKELVYTLALTGPTRGLMQDKLSFANYWNDPRPSYAIIGKPAADYLSGNTFLPVLNNNPHRGTQGEDKEPNATEAARYKRNFLRLKKAVFTAGTADDMIIPWNSGVFDFYDASGEKTVPLTSRPLWTDDWLGLRELNSTGRLVLTTASGVAHNSWAHSQSVFNTYIRQHLPTRP